MAKLTDVIAELARLLNLDELTPGEDGSYLIVFDDALNIEIVPMGQSQFVLRSPLAALPEDPRDQQEFLKGYLQRNLALLNDSAAAITVGGDPPRAWLYRTGDAAALDSQTALELIENFVNLADRWSQFEPAARPARFTPTLFDFSMRP